MANFLAHIEALLGSSDRTQPKADTTSWTRISKILKGEEGQGFAEDDSLWEERDYEAEASVLDLYRLQEPSGTPDTSLLLSVLYKKADADHISQSVLSILSSHRTNDEISGELCELLGYDEIELVMQILDNRSAVIQQLNVGPTFSKHDNSVVQSKQSKNESYSFSKESVRRRMQQQLDANASRPLYSGTEQAAPEILPHVYTSSNATQGNVVSQFGSKYMLPLGTTRETYEEYEEVVIPPAKPVPPRSSERLINISELESIVQGSFTGYSALNRIQSIVYPTAFGSNENMLICAPTGAGKTDVAMLTILRVIDQHRLQNKSSSNLPIHQTIDRDAFKIIYVAPMKALASEIVRKLGKRLAWLSIEVRELTGDMQLTKAEIARTQVIVTTPEKWDVVTRKPTGEGEIASSLKLLIIDEVHLLNEERGAVIETIVARTLRQVESSQSMIRIVGLSATLPNYKDVAEFLSVSRHKGLFYFDSSFRPVPLEQHFLGIKGKPGSSLSRKNLDTVTFQKVSDLVAEGHQVMVFVHARKETVKTATSLREMAVLEGNMEHFICEDHPQFNFFRQKIGESRNKEMKQLFDSGFGIHHAGMLRSDRNMMERMFEARAIKVLCCTATLAWGVNLPAHAVVIKGTQVYDSGKGKFVDLSVLDVLQIFGRAGRPGLESSGEGYICTTEDKLTHYLDAVTSSIPIESQFQAGLMDALNAEIALGTVANRRDAVQWLGYTYLFVRMRMNPFVYGIPRESVEDDPQLGTKRNELIAIASKKLFETKMITYDAQQSQFQITDLGRIAAKYYIRYTSIEIFNKEFRPRMSEADVLAMLSMSTEFEQIQVRESEVKELEEIMERVPCEVKGGTDTSAGKVNILLQGYISREMVEDFALVSDMAYVAQNGGRIVRALLEIAVSKKWANVTSVLMAMSKSIEGRMWSFDHPLRQFNLKPETMFSLEKWADDLSVSDIAGMEASSIGEMVHLNEAHGLAILNAAKQFPTIHITYTLRPITSEVLKISVGLTRAFEWASKVHGTSEPFWIWIEEEKGANILQLSHIIFHPTTEFLDLDFFISIPNGQLPQFVTIRSISDRWVGAEDSVMVTFDYVIMPPTSRPHTPVLNLPFLTIDDIQSSFPKDVIPRRFHTLNVLQTQSYWNFIHNKRNALICAPAASGKSTLARMAVWNTISKLTDGWILVITPTKIAAMDMVSELRPGANSNGILLEYGGDTKRLFSTPKSRTIRVATADQLIHAFPASIHLTKLTRLELVVCDAMEQLTSAYEFSISMLRLAAKSSPVRFIGLSSSINDASDLAKWLSVDSTAIHSFRPQDRDQSLITTRKTFSIPYSASLFKAMAKPAHRAIQDAPPGSLAIVFVPSRGQCRSIALDLITRCTLEMETGRGYIPDVISDDLVGDYCARLQDTSLLDYVLKGVGFYHQGIPKHDRNLMLEMFAEGIIRVLVVPKDSCWSLPARASVVVVMGTQYVHIEEEGSLRQIRDYSLTEVVRMQSRAIQESGTGHFHLFCQADALETYSRFLDEGLPLESDLAESETLRDWVKSLQSYSTNADKQQIVDALSFTYLAQRVVSNPSYYGFTGSDRDTNLSAIVDHVIDEIYAKK
ncbi:Putative helicase mug81 [Psilocybe cubensis]|uniref:Sec63-domain-containing protein n=2 Tax=Psilocybe cubensis TaxID=181762 RepID=A0A8H8CL29_PSICU|nr:Putative helicase mug81 [Psilocybe cubensis]KAH9482395.1 Putative helicase mug81 [Psilocybe cubensis]